LDRESGNRVFSLSAKELSCGEAGYRSLSGVQRVAQPVTHASIDEFRGAQRMPWLRLNPLLPIVHPQNLPVAGAVYLRREVREKDSHSAATAAFF
jgi:hypothetical protein